MVVFMFSTEKRIKSEEGAVYVVGDTVTVEFDNGCKYEGCEIVKITDNGFHFRLDGKFHSIQYRSLQNIF